VYYDIDLRKDAHQTSVAEIEIDFLTVRIFIPIRYSEFDFDLDFIDFAISLALAYPDKNPNYNKINLNLRSKPLTSDITGLSLELKRDKKSPPPKKKPGYVIIHIPHPVIGIH
jgi:hypothetical protein